MKSMVSPSIKDRPSDTLEVKERLLQVARHLLSTEGREGASSRAICALAGVGAPTIYHYFGDLTGLHRAAIDETYVQVAEAYQQGANERGPQQGLRNGWGAFNHFAHQEPLMCRIVIQQILAGEPPATVAETLRTVENDLSRLNEEGVLNCPAHEAVQLLWIGTLGTACFTSIKKNEEQESYPALQERMVDIVLNALFSNKIQ
ncbi:TetR/AcrR family transcriptional regulator [Pseudomonas sp. BN414]|uniref:TetR/AcrR family transcriptional regulator n=1 Tax=unclassified Pseudomonas TaxID=196821 RepID=UPI002454AF79|nr:MULTISPECIES: TetR/AcrR family transcriptional regulator [unclassified Pseudomonas]MDH4565248.1 TetR/AcrR family transcriptional regulator [Pseudomonas sp. BN414]MDH4581970.1 TetR/AcrR family transcriptional regulator [Pseudomonas sp. BN415]